MSTSTRLKIFIGSWCLFAAMSCAIAAPGRTFEQEIAAVAERVYLMPQAVQPTLARLQADYAPLSTQRQALLYEQMGKAKFHSGDFQGTLEYGVLLETLGKKNDDDSAECLGLLYQVFGNWKLGKIQVAYALAHQARQFPSETLSTYVLVNSLLTTAQMEAEEHHAEEAVQAATEAVRLAKGLNAPSTLFMATQMQVAVALSVGKHTVAQVAVNQLLNQGELSPYPERRVRAKGMEFAVASFAGMTQRANQAIAERLRLVRALQLDEALVGTLVDYANHLLKSKRYSEAAALSEEALQQGAILFDMRLSNSAHFIHAIANIYLGKTKEGKAEVERLFTSNQERVQLLSFLPEYAAVLTQAGDADASVQAAAIRKRLEFEDALHRAKESEKASGQLNVLSRESQPKVLVASNAYGQSIVWLMVATGLALGLIALLYLYGRRRFWNRNLSSTRQAIEIP